MSAIQEDIIIMFETRFRSPLHSSALGSQIPLYLRLRSILSGLHLEGFTELPFTQFLKQECKSDKIAVGFARCAIFVGAACRVEHR